VVQEFQLRLSQASHYVYDGTFVRNDFGLHGNYLFHSNWRFTHNLAYRSESLDTRGLRGGPAILRPGSASANLSLTTDGSKDWVWWLYTYYDRTLEGDSGTVGLWPGFLLKSGSRMRFNFSLGYTESNYAWHWMGKQDAVQREDDAYFLARLRRDTLQTTIRMDYNFSPAMSLSFYGNLYLTSGLYSDYKLVTDPQASDLKRRFHLFSEGNWWRDEGSQLQMQGDDGLYALDDPDFDYRSFRSNLVFRWEYRPGSTLFLVWSHDRQDSELTREGSWISGMERLQHAEANNRFLVKASYWFSI
jgi:hypothetical protein